MKNVLLTAMAVIMVLFPSAHAKQRGADINVTAPPTVQVWAAKLARTLDERMRYPRALGPAERLAGFVHVRFAMESDGSLKGMWLSKTSGNRKIDRAALDAVSRLNRVSVMPIGIQAGRKIEAHLFFAEDEQQMRDLIAANKAYRGSPADAVASAEDKPLLLASLARMPGRQ